MKEPIRLTVHREKTEVRTAAVELSPMGANHLYYSPDWPGGTGVFGLCSDSRMVHSMWRGSLPMVAGAPCSHCSSVKAPTNATVMFRDNNLPLLFPYYLSTIEADPLVLELISAPLLERLQYLARHCPYGVESDSDVKSFGITLLE